MFFPVDAGSLIEKARSWHALSAFFSFGTTVTSRATPGVIHRIFRGGFSTKLKVNSFFCFPLLSRTFFFFILRTPWDITTGPKPLLVFRLKPPARLSAVIFCSMHAPCFATNSSRVLHPLFLRFFPYLASLFNTHFHQVFQTPPPPFCPLRNRLGNTVEPNFCSPAGVSTHFPFFCLLSRNPSSALHFLPPTNLSTAFFFPRGFQVVTCGFLPLDLPTLFFPP